VAWYNGFLYEAASWKRAVDGGERRVPCGELLPRVRLIVPNMSLRSRAVVQFYNKRGMAEQWIKQRKQVVKMTQLTCQ
jgi:hypothetical protein